jgi:HD-like signal output (HDOD) protein
MRDRRRRVLEALHRIPDLPNFPEAVYRLEEVASNPDSSVRQIAAIIETDPPMAARIMRLANSAFYRRGNHPMTTIPQAVVRLGLKEVRKLCLTIGATRLFVRPSPRIQHNEFWEHSIAVAALTRIVATHVRDVRVDPDQAYVAGLLHEVGALVFDHYLSSLYDAVFRAARDSGHAIHEVESEYLDINHAEVGAWLLGRWNAPPTLAAAVQFHHHPNEAPEELRPLCQLVHVADYVCSAHGVTGPGEDVPLALSVAAWEDLGLNVALIESLKDEVQAEVERSRDVSVLVAA